MTLTGYIQNGVVVLDSCGQFPEGTRVCVTLASEVKLPNRDKRRIEFPPVRTGTPGTWNLTNEQIGEIFEQEEVAVMKGSWNVPS